MIDFPASPTDGQLFTGINGVIYRYSSTHTAWLSSTAAPAIGGSGDFCAYTTANFSLGALVTLIPTGITSGNGGSWYNTTTGRYTPPAGRYRILGWLNSFNAGASLIQLIMRKNGANIGISGSSVAFQCTAGAWAAGTCDLVIDANGSDFFDFQASAGAGSTSNNFVFGAFSLTGMQGPQGLPGLNIGSAFGAQLAANQSVGSASTVTVANYTEFYDNENTFNPATGVWTPTTGGVYRVSGFGAMSAGAACSVQFLVRNITGGTDLAGCDSTISGASFSISMSFSTVFRITAGISLDLRARTVSPVAATILSGQFTGFNATYVAP